MPPIEYLLVIFPYHTQTCGESACHLLVTLFHLDRHYVTDGVNYFVEKRVVQSLGRLLRVECDKFLVEIHPTVAVGDIPAVWTDKLQPKH